MVNTACSAVQPSTYWNGTSYVAGGKAGRQNNRDAQDYQAGGGGGAGTPSFNYANGTDGVTINISGSPRIYAVGGGARQYFYSSSAKGKGGSGGVGSNGRIWNGSSYERSATSGQMNTGSGGGGGAYTQDPDVSRGSGGSGMVIIRSKIKPVTIDNDYKNMAFPYIKVSQTLYSVNFPENTVCDLLILGETKYRYLTGQQLNRLYNITVRDTSSIIKNDNTETYNDNKQNFPMPPIDTYIF